MLDRLDACLHADLILSVLYVLLKLCFFFDRLLSWVACRAPGRVRRALLRLEFRFFNWPWRALQEKQRYWQRRLDRELSVIQTE